MEIIIKKAKWFIKHNKVKLMSKGISGSIYEVYGNKLYPVRIFNKEGRKLITCGCFNGIYHLNQPTLCSHKLAVLLYESINIRHLDKIIKDYSFYVANKLKVNPDIILDDLNKLRRLL